MADDQVPVFWQDQDLCTSHPAFSWLRAECRAQRKVLGAFVDSGKKFRLYAQSPRVFGVSASSLRPSRPAKASTITTSEILANVGIGGALGEPGQSTIPVPENFVRNAQMKIREYQKIHDKKAALAVGRWLRLEGGK